jgi:imidazolonepropionase-like amidohydrolase
VVDVLPDSFVVAGATVFDGTRFRPAASVLVGRDRVTAVEERLTPPAGVPVVEATGGTLLPGLVDSHTHVSAGALEAALRCGVTTELDMFADPGLVRSLKARASADPAGLADVRSAGTGATAPGGHPTVLVDRGQLAPFPTIASPEQAGAFVAARIAEGSDHLKVVLEDGTTTGRPVPRLAEDVLRALVAAAHAEGLRVVAHALTRADALAAVRAGVDGLAHLFLDRPPSAEFVDAAARSGVFVIPTLTSLAARCGHRRGRALAADPRLGPLLDAGQRSSLQMDFPAGPGARADLQPALDAVPRLHTAGVTLLAGTDAASPGTAHGASLHDELVLLVRAGLTPGEALTAATRAPADCFPTIADRGRIAPGSLADLLLVEGDLRADVTATRAIRAVWRHGRRVPPRAERD